MTVADLGAHQTSACNGSRDSVFRLIRINSTQRQNHALQYVLHLLGANILPNNGPRSTFFLLCTGPSE